MTQPICPDMHQPEQWYGEMSTWIQGRGKDTKEYTRCKVCGAIGLVRKVVVEWDGEQVI